MLPCASVLAGDSAAWRGEHYLSSGMGPCTECIIVATRASLRLLWNQARGSLQGSQIDDLSESWATRLFHRSVTVRSRPTKPIDA
jgi:hypothetical protein